MRIRKVSSVFRATFPRGCLPIPKGTLKFGVGLGREGAGEEPNPGNKGGPNRLALTGTAVQFRNSSILENALM